MRSITEKPSSDPSLATNITIIDTPSLSNGKNTSSSRPDFLNHHFDEIGSNGSKDNHPPGSRLFASEKLNNQSKKSPCRCETTDQVDQLFAKIKGSVHAMRIYVERRLKEQQQEIFDFLLPGKTIHCKIKNASVNRWQCEYPDVQMDSKVEHFSILGEKIKCLIKSEMDQQQSRLEKIIKDEMMKITVSHRPQLDETLEATNARPIDLETHTRPRQDFLEK